MNDNEAINLLEMLRKKYHLLTYEGAEAVSLINSQFVEAINIGIKAIESKGDRSNK